MHRSVLVSVNFRLRVKLYFDWELVAQRSFQVSVTSCLRVEFSRRLNCLDQTSTLRFAFPNTVLNSCTKPYYCNLTFWLRKLQRFIRRKNTHCSLEPFFHFPSFCVPIVACLIYFVINFQLQFEPPFP